MRLKPDREATAAYAASQPLFDALKTASDRAGEQRVHLAKARDLVQNLHVNLVDTTKTDDAQKHEQYVECLMKAWTSATEAYCGVFEELCRITAPDATVGRAAGKGYEHFKIMADTATAASKQAKSYHVAARDTRATSRAETTAPIASGKRARDSDEPERDEEQATEILCQKGNARARRRKRAKLAAQKSTGVDTTNQEHDAKANATDIKDEVKIKLEPPAPAQDHTPLNRDPEPEPVSAGKENNIPGVEYEDVSAEVAARLKAKEAKKKAKKEQKKRKRESGDTAVAEVTPPEKPSKKKPKIDGTPAEKNGAVKERQTKRGQNDGAEEDASGVPAKRRKGKA